MAFSSQGIQINGNDYLWLIPEDWGLRTGNWGVRGVEIVIFQWQPFYFAYQPELGMVNKTDIEYYQLAGKWPKQWHETL